MAFTTTIWLQALGAALVVALGAAVLVIRPVRAPNAWFGVFAVALGGQFVVTNLALGLDADGAWWAVAGRIVLRAVATVGAVGFAVAFPSRFGPGWRRVLAPASFVFAVLLAFGLAASAAVSARGRFSMWGWVEAATWPVMFSALFFLLFVLCARHGRARGDAEHETGLTLVSAALLLYVGFASGSGSSVSTETSAFAPHVPDALANAMFLVALCVLSVWWAMNITGSARPRAARHVAWLAVAAPIVGILYLVHVPDFGMLGVVRLAAVAVFAYAIVRHQVLGIDVRLRWGISRSTMAAAFIAVFFIVSEGAQELFQDRTGSRFLGIAAAGALVFVLAPLQRVADGFAARAVPVHVGPGSRIDLPPNEVAFLRAVRLARRGGPIDRAAEHELLVLAESLQIGAARALALCSPPDVSTAPTEATS